MAALPWAVVYVAVPAWSVTLDRPLLVLVGWGVLFGIASLLYGVAVELLGIALGFAVQLGLSIVLGALLPLIGSRALSLSAKRDAIFLCGLALMVAGVILCAQAGGASGRKNGAPPVPEPAPARGHTRFRKGLMIAFVGGVLAPSLNFGIQYGTRLFAPLEGTSSGGRFPVESYLAWAIFLSASAVVQAGFCFLRILKTKTTAAFRASGARRDALQVAAMSSVWISSVFVYGRSVFGLGRFGPSFGWPVFIAFIILTSNAWGVVLGEWKGATRAAFGRMLAGSAVLVVAAFLIGQGSKS